MTRKSGMGLGSLLLAGAAAFAYYKYSKMSDQQRRDLVNNLKEQGKKFYDEKIPSNVKDIFTKKANAKDDFTHA
jgi:hypothetical protein